MTDTKMIRMGGKWVPVSKPFGSAPAKEKRFLIVLQYHNGDISEAEELASLIADLERTRNHDADILLFARRDAKDFPSGAKAKLESKFDKVMFERCRRIANGHPFAPNEMFYDLVTLLPTTMPYRTDYDAFINLEPDVVPLRPGWIGELYSEWKKANSEGLSAVGFIHEKPKLHMNGVAVWALDIWRRVGRNILSGGGPQVPYDVRHRDSILPHAKQTALIDFTYRRGTITPQELFAPRPATNAVPAIHHGVKDGSARAAVRARHITMTDVPSPEPVHRPPVYTYFHAQDSVAANETTAILNAWKQGWTSRGWNPIVLSYRDAQKHPRFAEFEAAVAKLPTASADKQRASHQFFRWLALDCVGGGLLTDYDVLPEEFTPANKNNPPACAFRDFDTARLFAGEFSNGHSTSWVDAIIKYDPQPTDVLGDKPNVTDDTISRFEAHSFQTGALVHFGTDLIGTERKSVAMERFLRGK